MQKFYIWNEDGRHLDFEFKNPKGFDQIEEKIDLGERVTGSWQDFPFKLEKKKKIGDFPFLELLFKPISEKALNCLRNILEPHVEIFPLRIVNSDLKYYGLNVLKIYDADKQGVDTFVFSNNQLPDVPIFRLKGYRFICISSELRKLIEKHQLVGLRFDETLKYRIRNGEDKQQNGEIEKNETDFPPHKTYKIRKKNTSLEFKHYPVEDIGPPITKKMLLEFEKNLPRALPDDYRDFLKQCNGGSMDEENNAFYITGIPGFTKTRKGDEGFAAWFDSLNPNKNEDEEDLLSQYLSIRGEGVFPNYCLPIGSDYGGNLILLSLGEEDYGHIYFWDHEQGWDEAGSLEPDYSHCYFVAKSFTELIDSLHHSSS